MRNKKKKGNKIRNKICLVLIAMLLISSLLGCSKIKALLSNDTTESTEVALSESEPESDLATQETESEESEETEETGRIKIEENYVMLPRPEIAKESFANGFYEEYIIRNISQIYVNDYMLLSGAIISFTDENGEEILSGVEITYEVSDNMVNKCKVELLPNFVYATNVFVLNEKGKKDDKAYSYDIVFEEPVELDLNVVCETILNYLFDNAVSEEEEDRAHALGTIYAEYFNCLNECNFVEGNSVKLKIDELGKDYFFQYGPGYLGEQKITYDPGWTIDMGVSEDEVHCQIEIEKDENGNITLVHRYNDYACYDIVYTYAEGGYMVRCDVYEYAKGQDRDTVGTTYHTEYFYDDAGRVVKIVETGDKENGVNITVEYIYDENGILVQQTEDIEYFGNSYYLIQQTYDRLVQTYTYDEEGKVGKVTLEVIDYDSGTDVYEYEPWKK